MDPRFQRLRVVWLGLVGGVASYTAVVYGLVTFGAIGAVDISPGVLRMVGGAGVLYMAAGIGLRRRMLARVDDVDGPDERFARYRVATILGLAVVESGGLVVVTLGMLAGTPTWVLAGGAASLWMMILFRPKADEGGVTPRD